MAIGVAGAGCSVVVRAETLFGTTGAEVVGEEEADEEDARAPSAEDRNPAIVSKSSYKRMKEGKGKQQKKREKKRR